MEVCILAEPSRGLRYAELLAVAMHVDQCGYTGLFVTDHYLPPAGGLPGPTDSWVTLAGLARETSRIRLGTLVSSATFRRPGPLAIAVAQVDVMSGGRVELGLGAGWYEAEHTAYGIPFRTRRERFDRLAEQLEVITGLWSTPIAGTFRFRGRRHRLVDAPAVTCRVPVIVGGRGLRRTPDLAARFADEYNAAFLGVTETAARYERVAATARVLCRPMPRLSAALTVALGDTLPEARRRAEPLRQHGALPAETPLVGVPSQLADLVGAYAAIGTTRMYLRLPDVTDFEHLELIASAVVGTQVGV